MALPLALPLAPVVSSGASAAAVTFVAGSTLKLIDSIYGFRRPTPTLPPITGLEGVATLRKLIGDAIAGARIPVAMPPSPLGPNGSVAAIAAAAGAAGIWQTLKGGASQLWGLLSGRPAGTPTTSGGLPQTALVEGSANITTTGSFSTTTKTTLVASGIASGIWQGKEPPEPYQTALQGPWTIESDVGIVGLEIVYGAPRPKGGFESIALVARRPDGLLLGLGVNASGGDVDWLGLSASVSTSTTAADAQNAAPIAGTGPAPLPDRSKVLDQIRPASVPAPQPLAPLPLVNPATTPGPQPQTQPQVVPVQPGPSRPAVPAIAPARPPTIAPWLFPGAIPAAQQTTPAGAVAPLPLPLPQPTPAGNIFPVAGAPPLTEAGPRATIQAIATEVGRIEQKVDRMLNPVPPNNGLDRLGELMALIGRLVEALLSAQTGGSYTMEGPCEVDSSGEPIVDIREVRFPGALTVLGVMVNRLDALAVLLQEHKNLRQPTCRKKAPVGEFVTVNFEQI